MNYLDSPYAIPIGSFRTKQPVPSSDPDAGELVQVCFNKAWLPLILGSLLQLLLQYTWDTSDPATLALAQMRANQLIYMFQIAKPCNQPVSAQSGAEDELLIRQNPDNPCILETSINGTDWCAFADFSKCVGSISQPGGGSPQPAPGGGDQCYDGHLISSQQFLIPTVVNTGDVVTLSHVKGASTDNGLTWYCPDGSSFFAGTCSGIGSTDPGDPLPTAKHMAIILGIGGTFYDISSGPITVPGGIVNQQAVIQVNTPSLTANSGSYEITVCVTNNQSLTWCNKADFALNQSGYIHAQAPFDPSGTWSAGSGWIQSDAAETGGTHWRGVDIIFNPSAAFDATQIEIGYDYTQGIGMSGLGAVIVDLWQGGTPNGAIIIPAASQANGTGFVVTATTTLTGITKIQVVLHTDQDSSSFGGFTGHCLLKYIKINGKNANPYGSSNC